MITNKSDKYVKLFLIRINNEIYPWIDYIIYRKNSGITVNLIGDNIIVTLYSVEGRKIFERAYDFINEFDTKEAYVYLNELFKEH